MSNTWYNADRVSTPGSATLGAWLAGRPGGAERAGLAVPAVQNEVATVLSSDPRVIDFFGVQASASGKVVNASTAQLVSTNYACVSKIAGGISTMPLRIYERQWDQAAGQYQRKPVDNMDLWWLLNERPTDAFSAASHWELGVQAMLLRGDGFSLLERRASGGIKGIVPLDWCAVTPMRRKNGRLMYAVNDGYGSVNVDQDDMVHIAGFGFDGERSPSVISRAARSAVGNALAMDEYAGRFFSSGAHHNFVLETDKKMDPDLVLNMQRMFAEKYSGLANAHARPLVLTEGLQAKAVTMTAEDTQLLEARRFQVIDICRAYGVLPHMVGESSASTAWGSGLESLGRVFVTYTLQPHLVRIEQELNFKLFRTAKYFVEFDRTALQAGDSKTQADADKAALGGPGAGPGSISVNEVRRRRNMPPIDDPRYDKPYWPPDKADASATGGSGDPADPPDPHQPGPGNPGRTGAHP